MHMKKQIFVRAAASAAVLILLSPLLAGAAAAVQPDVSRSASGNSADAAAGPVRAESPRLSAKSAVLLDAYTGRVLYASHAEDKSLIASTTKIMTALVICEAGDLDRTVVIPPEAVGIEGSSMYLKAGEVLSVHELLYGLMLRSGNDAAVALALADSGSISAFAARMNEKAAVLGLKNTHYANPHGLDNEENYSTALDLARLTRFALQNPDFAQLVSTKSVTIGDRVKVGSKSGLDKDVPDDEIRFGYPALPGMQYHRSAAVFKRLPELAQQVRALEKQLAELTKK